MAQVSDIVWQENYNNLDNEKNTPAAAAMTGAMAIFNFMVRVPNLDSGGWRAVRLQSRSTFGWLKNGELDRMEIGQNMSFRDLWNSHNSGTEKIIQSPSDWRQRDSVF